MDKCLDKIEYSMRASYTYYYIVTYRFIERYEEGIPIYSEEKLGYLTKHYPSSVERKEYGGDYNTTYNVVYYVLHTIPDDKEYFVYNHHFTEKIINIKYIVIDVAQFSPKYITRRLTQKELQRIHYTTHGIKCTNSTLMFNYERGKWNDLIVSDEERRTALAKYIQ